MKRPDGSIMHAEVRIGDSILMMEADGAHSWCEMTSYCFESAEAYPTARR